MPKEKEERVKETAHQAYKRNFDDARKLMNKIGGRLMVHAGKYWIEGKTNWAHVGDIAHIKTELEELFKSVESFGGES